MISVVIPTLNAAPFIGPCLASLVPAAVEGVVNEVVITDGGSADEISAIADQSGAKFIETEKGRGSQLRAGADNAKGPWLLFLHADTVLEPGWERAAIRFIKRAERQGSGFGKSGPAAAFRFALDDGSGAARRLEWMVRLRMFVMKLPYGDQGLLIHRRHYEALGGYADMPLMEDVDMIRRIGRKNLVLLDARAVTSADKYRRDGYLKRSTRNLGLLALYYLGFSPERLARLYS